MILRYEKLTDKQISELVRDVINDDDVNEQSYYYRKECVKVQTNIFTWKNHMLSCMKVSQSLHVFRRILTCILLISFRIT